ncbi:MAG: FtsW/RodA/SpoVE family cell cycle protein [Deltaproteobacteria bacterium]|nr:FtsW/RodA/SpoVE family cell cycle protein [Deltaproteobacteria bacterium]
MSVTYGDQRGPDTVRSWPVGLMMVALMIPAVGIVNLYSAAQNFMDPNIWLKQMLWACAGFVMAGVVARTKPTTLELTAWPVYIVTCVLLVLVLAIGVPIKGAQRWLDLGFFNMQPSELAKLAMMLVVARYFAGFEMQGGYTLLGLARPLNPSRPLGLVAMLGYRLYDHRKDLCVAFKKNGLEVPSLGDVIAKANALTDPPKEIAAELAETDPDWLVPTVLVVAAVWFLIAIVVTLRRGVDHRAIIAPADIVFVPFVLVLIEPDLGTASIVLAVAASQILFAGMRPRDLILAIVGAVGVAGFAWNNLLHDYQRKRVETFMNPEADIQGSGYHAAQSIIAVGSGRLTGKGWGEGTQTQLSFLPENHTDFAFSVLGEEWGFVGGVVLIVLFAALVGLMMRCASKATDRFSALLAVGAAAMLFWHAFINIGMVIGVLPVVGVTLPLVSYGGSSMITKGIAIGFAVNAAVHARRS